MVQKIFLVAGARPNFMKVAPLWWEFQKYPEIFNPMLIHSGQHYDTNMSDAFFKDLGLPEPDKFLGVGSGTHAEQTAKVMVEFEKVCVQEQPNLVVVVGDVNSTMACAITAKKLCIPVAHIEAGLRSRDWTMPEEINRVVTDAVSDYLFTPSRDADTNLLREGASPDRIHFVGNIMIDALVSVRPKAEGRFLYRQFGLPDGGYGLVTLHRPSNVDDPLSLEYIFKGLAQLNFPLIFPIHPRTRKNLKAFDLIQWWEGKKICLIDPLGYYDFLSLLMHARFVLTDSGGVQEEATYLGIPCLTLRKQTERPITILEGTNELVTVSNLSEAVERILKGLWKQGRIPELWDGRTAQRVASTLMEASL